MDRTPNELPELLKERVETVIQKNPNAAEDMKETNFSKRLKARFGLKKEGENIVPLGYLVKIHAGRTLGGK